MDYILLKASSKQGKRVQGSGEIVVSDLFAINVQEVQLLGNYNKLSKPLNCLLVLLFCCVLFQNNLSDKDHQQDFQTLYCGYVWIDLHYPEESVSRMDGIH